MFQFQPLVLNLEKEVFFPKNIGVGRSYIPRRCVLVLHQQFRNFALQASGKSNQSLRMFCEELFAYPRLVIKAMKRRLGGNFDQVAISFVSFSEH